MTAEEVLKKSFDKHISKLFSVEFYETKGDNGYDWIYEAMQEVADLSFDAGYERAEHDERGFAATPPDKEQFIKELFDTSKTKTP